MSVVFPEPNSYVVRLNDGRLFRRTHWAINILVCDSTINPVRPCFHRPTAVGLPTATVPVGSSVIGHLFLHLKRFLFQPLGLRVLVVVM